MKKGFFISILILLLMGFVSGAYICYDGSEVIENIRSIKIGEIKPINGLLVGVIRAKESAAVGRIESDLMIDAQLINLTNTSSRSIYLSDGKSYSIRLINSTGIGANIGVGGSNKVLENGESYKIGELEVFLIDSQGPEDLMAEIMVGFSSIHLSNYNNLTANIMVNKKEYLLELYSASNTEATIKVRKCNNESLKVMELKNNSLTNKTNNETEEINYSSDEGNTGNLSNDTSNKSEDKQEDTQNQISGKQNQIIKYTGIGGIILLILICIILGIKYKKNSTIQEATETKLS